MGKAVTGAHGGGSVAICPLRHKIEANRRALIEDIFRRLEKALEPFADDLECFLAALFQARLPSDWREQWHEFVDDQATKGFTVQPESVVSLENWIEARARLRGRLPVAPSPIEPDADEPGSLRSGPKCQSGNALAR
jgi:hypothetical protein